MSPHSAQGLSLLYPTSGPSAGTGQKGHIESLLPFAKGNCLGFQGSEQCPLILGCGYCEEGGPLGTGAEEDGWRGERALEEPGEHCEEMPYLDSSSRRFPGLHLL